VAGFATEQNCSNAGSVRNGLDYNNRADFPQRSPRVFLPHDGKTTGRRHKDDRDFSEQEKERNLFRRAHSLFLIFKSGRLL
jgi:hypothetical protein